MTELKEKKVTIKIKLNGGSDELGKPIYKNISIKDIDPEITDDDLYQVANSIAGLQRLAIVEIYKLQNDKVINS